MSHNKANACTLPIRKFSPSKAEENDNDEILEKTASEHTGTLFLLENDITRKMGGKRWDKIILFNAMQTALAKHKHIYMEGMSCIALVKYISNIKQTGAEYGNYQPFGVHVSYMGLCMRFNYQLFQSDSKGNSYVWMYTAIGQNSEVAKSIMQKDVIMSGYQINLKQAKILALKAFIKAFKFIVITEEYVVIMTLKSVEGKIVITQILNNEIRELVDYLGDDVTSCSKSQRRLNDKIAAKREAEFFLSKKRKSKRSLQLIEDSVFMDVEPENEDEFCEALRGIDINVFSEYFQKAAKYGSEASDLSEYETFLKNPNIVNSTPQHSRIGSPRQTRELNEEGFGESNKASGD